MEQLPSDGELIMRFAKAGDEAPFQELMQRHGQMVAQVCLRVLRNSADAEDATQAVFLALAQKCGDFSLQHSVSLGGWLHTLAWRISKRLSAAATVRKKYEREAAAMNVPITNSSKTEALRWDKLRPLLDEALADIPEKYRTIFVLCDLEGRSQEETAALIHAPQRTVWDRLKRARELLRKRLERRGIVLPAAILAALVTTHARAGTLSPAFIASTAKAASLSFHGKLVASANISGQAAVLVQHALGILLWSTLRTAALVLLAVILASTGGVLTYVSFAQGRAPKASTSATPVPTNLAPADTIAQNAPTKNVADLKPIADPPAQFQGIPIVPSVPPSSVRVNKGKMLFVAFAEGLALIDFTGFGIPNHGARSASYRWRFRPTGGAPELSGNGVLFENYEITTRRLKDSDSVLTIPIGPVYTSWSHGGSSSAWIYFPPNATHFRLLDNATYDTFGVRPSGDKAHDEL